MRIAYFDCSQGASARLMLGALCAAHDNFRTGASSESYRLPGGIKLRCLHRAQGEIIGRCVEDEIPSSIDADAGLSEAELVGFSRSAAFGKKGMVMAENVVAAINESLEETRPSARRSFSGVRQKVTARMVAEMAAVIMKLEALGVEKVYYSPVNAGGSKGRFERLPSLAALKLAEMGDMRIFMTPEAGELLTLDGAALLSTLGRCEKPDMDVIAEGHGFMASSDEGVGQMRAVLAEIGGTNDTADTCCAKTPNESVVKAVSAHEKLPAEIPEAPASSAQSTSAQADAKTSCAADNLVVIIECNIDDMTGEQLAYACEKLLASGALDVWQTPIIMKKGRMGAQVSVLCRAGDEERFADIMLRETTTLGVRMAEYRRRILPRQSKTIDTQYGDIRVKTAPGKAAPEYDDCRRAAREHDVPIVDIYDSARQAYIKAANSDKK